MNLIQLLLTGVCAAAGIGALMVGNCLEAFLIWMVPIGYFSFVRIRAAREERRAKLAKQQEESDRFWAKERELRRAEHTKSSAEIYERHRAAQMQQMNMMNQPTGVHASTISPSGPPVTDTPPSRVDPIQFHSFVNSGSESTSSYFNDSSSSSSSYSSDTSSDSFGGSDTSSDSF